MKEHKYYHNDLVEAVQEIKERGGFQHEVEASKRAGEILKKALKEMDNTVNKEIKTLEAHDSGYQSEDTFNNDLGL